MVSDVTHRSATTDPASTRLVSGRRRRILRSPLLTVALVVGAIKMVFLALDPGPYFFSGDSLEFLTAAVNRWVSDLRSFTYPGVIAVITRIWPSLAIVVAVQTTAGWATVVAVNHILRTHLGFGRRLALMVCCGLAVAPLGLYYERTIMTEASACFVLTICLLIATKYLAAPRAILIVLLHLVAIVLVSLRTAYVPSVLTVIVALPLVPLVSWSWTAWRRGNPNWVPVRRAGAHLLIGVLCVTVFHTGYKVLLGHLTGREPAYQYWGGYFLLSSWGSFAIPEDAADPRMVELLASPSAHLGERGAVNDRMWASDGLIAQVRSLDSNPALTERLARHTAYNSARRDPTAVMGYAMATWADYLDPRGMDARLKHDRGAGIPLKPQLTQLVEKHFDLVVPASWPSQMTPVKRWHAHAGLWVHLLALTPLFGAVAIASCEKKLRPTMIFLTLLSLSVLMTSCTFGTSIVRYLQPQEVFMALFVMVIGRKAAELIGSHTAAAKYRRGLSADATSSACCRISTRPRGTS